MGWCIMIQAVFNYEYGPEVPAAVREGCAAGQISLLNAEKCLFYRYNQLGWIKYVWAIGLLAAGQSSTMTVSEWVWLLQYNIGMMCVLFLYTGYICRTVCYGGKYCDCERREGEKESQSASAFWRIIISKIGYCGNSVLVSTLSTCVGFS